MVSKKELGDKVRKITKEINDFYIHFVVYIIVNLFIFIQWWYISEGEGFPWFITTTGGWGIGILAHFIVTYRKIREYQKSNNKKS